MISLIQVSKSFGDVKAIDDVTLDIAEENQIAIVGPSGSGKTTLLRLIAGLEIPDRGEIYIDNTLASTPKWTLEPHRRKLGFVFQTPALWPHMTVAQNILFGLHSMGKEEATGRLNAILNLISLEGLEHRYPHQLSGGEARRVSLARTLAPRPKYILMDEPLTNLDIELKNRLLSSFQEAVRTTGACLIYVTHDLSEAEQVAHKIITLRNGRLKEAEKK
jgi:iron(III) transport system ATP-binding protein